MSPPESPTTDAKQRSFLAQAEAGHTLVPVVREVFSDLDTPLSVYLKLVDGPHAYLFESVEGANAPAAIRSSACRPGGFTHSPGTPCT